MKKLNILFILFSFFLIQESFSQTIPHLFHYQAVVRDTNGEPYRNIQIAFKFTIIDANINCETGEASQIGEYEEHTIETNEFGLAIISDLGISGFLDNINWATGCNWLKVEVRKDIGDYSDMGKSRLVSVPYALYSDTAKVAQEVINQPMEAVGTVKLFWDAGGILSIPDGWMNMDGSQVLDPDSPLFGTFLPDMTNRYAIGDTAAVGTSDPIGNLNHEINLEHSHIVESHSHSISSHTHGAGSLKFQTFSVDYDGSISINGDGGAQTFNKGRLRGFQSNGSQQTILYNDTHFRRVDFDGSPTPYFHFNSANDATYYTKSGSGSTSSGGNGDTGNSSPAVDSQLSTTQSIQPESIGFKYIIKI